MGRLGAACELTVGRNRTGIYLNSVAGLGSSNARGQFNLPGVMQVRQALITAGPYRWVRHPIYTMFALFGLAGFLISANWLGDRRISKEGNPL